jgi:hypothetical protein
MIHRPLRGTRNWTLGERGRREPNSARTGGLPPSRVGQSEARHHPPPTNAESVIGSRTGPAVGGARCNDGAWTRTDVPFGAPLRTSRSDVRCARYGASVGTPASTGVLRAPAAKAKGADAAVGTVA